MTRFSIAFIVSAFCCLTFKLSSVKRLSRLPKSLSGIRTVLLRIQLANTQILVTMATIDPHSSQPNPNSVCNYRTTNRWPG
nr:MAG TPA: hypothetical protein [Caudoviricetes sp.]